MSHADLGWIVAGVFSIGALLLGYRAGQTDAYGNMGAWLRAARCTCYDRSIIGCPVHDEALRHG